MHHFSVERLELEIEERLEAERLEEELREQEEIMAAQQQVWGERGT